MIAIPHLQVQFAGQFLFGFVFCKNRSLFVDEHNVFPFRVRNAKDKSPIKIAFAGQRIIMNIRFLIILVKDPTMMNRKIFMFVFLIICFHLKTKVERFFNGLMYSERSFAEKFAE